MKKFSTIYAACIAVLMFVGLVQAEDLLYSPVTPCRIVDTRNTPAGIMGASTKRDFYAYGSGGTMSAQGGNPAGCESPLGEPLAVHINMVAKSDTTK